MEMNGENKVPERNLLPKFGTNNIMILIIIINASLRENNNTITHSSCDIG